MFFNVRNLAVDGDIKYGYITDNPTPVFSWMAEHSEDNKCQSAYRVVVKTEKVCKWDSGWIASDKQTAEYAGEALQSGEELFWSVQIRDNGGNESTVGENCFITALMNSWQAPWITTPWDVERETKYFQKKVILNEPIKKAYLYVCGIGYHHVTVNGKEVDEAYLQPAVSNYGKQCYYVTLPVKEYLCVGENTLEITIGEGWRRNLGIYIDFLTRPITFFGTPKVTAQLYVEYESGQVSKIDTDESWTCSRGPIVSNHLFDGETYDERIKTDYLQNAVLVSEEMPEMKAQTIRPILGHEILSPVVKTKVEDGYVFDFGTNIAGIIELQIPADMPKGTEVKIYHTENILPDGNIDPETLRKAKAMDCFISDGRNEERRWSPKFVYHGFRYIYVKGWHTIPQCENIKAISLYTDIKNRSFFRCGSAIVNQIQQCIIQTEKNNLHSIATDCPQRDERMGWLNDTTVRFEEIPYNFNMQRFFTKFIEDVIAEQSEDGAVTCTAPYVYGERPADPVCSSFLIAALENYLHYGDSRDIKKYYKNFKAWNECLKAHSEDGIVTYSHYGDWAGPSECCVAVEDARSIMTPGILMSTGYHYFNYKLLQQFATIMGDKQEAEKNAFEAERVRKAFLKKWWNEDTGKVDSGCPGSQAFALWLELLPKEKCELAAKILYEGVAEAGYRITTGNLNTRYVMDMLAKYGYVDAAWKIMTREECPSWGFMLQNGATTIWERFEFKRGSGMNSHDHPMYGAVGYWLYSHIAGLKPGANGWQEFEVQPYLPSDLLHAEAGVETPFGMVYIKWQKQLGNTDIMLSVPFGAKAKVKLPWGEEVLVGSGYHSFHK